MQKAQTKFGNKSHHGSLILMYHRIIDLPSDPFSLAVSPQNFEEHLNVLRKLYTPKSLEYLNQNIRNGGVAPRTVVITFDDGYFDNFHIAKLLLESYDIPATTFIVVGYINGEREFMWDELEKVFLQPNNLPEELKFCINDNVLEYDLGEDAIYDETDFLCNSKWNTEQERDPTIRHTLFRKLHWRLKFLSFDEQKKVLDQLISWSGIDRSVRDTHRTMNRDEIKSSMEGGLIEIGSHTVTHPVLSNLPVNSQKLEIEQSKSLLEKITGQPINSFAYPFGGKTDYDSETISLIRKSDHSCACSNFEGIINDETDLLQLPRIDVKNWSGNEFAKRLQTFI